MDEREQERQEGDIAPQETVANGVAEEQPQPDGQEGLPPPQPEKPGPQNAKEQLYDKIPLSYRQVDILVKVLVGILVVALVVGVLTGSRMGG